MGGECIHIRLDPVGCDFDVVVGIEKEIRTSGTGADMLREVLPEAVFAKQAEPPRG
jgi:hypothetical protein